jgi:hypothetical protein
LSAGAAAFSARFVVLFARFVVFFARAEIAAAIVLVRLLWVAGERRRGRKWSFAAFDGMSRQKAGGATGAPPGPNQGEPTPARAEARPSPGPGCRCLRRAGALGRTQWHPVTFALPFGGPGS